MSPWYLIIAEYFIGVVAGYFVGRSYRKTHFEKRLLEACKQIMDENPGDMRALRVVAALIRELAK